VSSDSTTVPQNNNSKSYVIGAKSKR